MQTDIAGEGFGGAGGGGVLCGKGEGCGSVSADGSCGDYSRTTSARYLEVLEFTHFVTMFEFDGGGHFRGNKHLITKINCSVVLDLGWGNTQEDLYTIEDRPKSES